MGMALGLSADEAYLLGRAAESGAALSESLPAIVVVVDIWTLL